MKEEFEGDLDCCNVVQPELRQRKWTDPVEFDVKSELKSLLMPLDEVGYCGVFLFVFFFLSCVTGTGQSRTLAASGQTDIVQPLSLRRQCISVTRQTDCIMARFLPRS